MRNPSLITTDLAVDPALAQNADFGFGPDDRQYLDNQIRGIEQHLVACLIGGTHATYARLASTSVAVQPGDTVCLASLANAPTRTVTKSTALALGNAKIGGGVVLLPASPGGFVLFAIGGIVGPTLTGLAAASPGFVKINTSTGRLQRVASLSSSDYGMGTVDNAGWMQVAQCLLISSGGSTPAPRASIVSAVDHTFDAATEFHVTFTVANKIATLPANPSDRDAFRVLAGGAWKNGLAGTGKSIISALGVASTYTQRVNGECTNVEYNAASGYWEIV